MRTWIIKLTTSPIYDNDLHDETFRLQTCKGEFICIIAGIPMYKCVFT